LLSTASDLLLIVSVVLVAFLFYGAIPGIGAFTVRARWRIFRRRMLESSLRPFVQYKDLSRPAAGLPDDGSLGSFRAFGTMEAMQGTHRIWINTGRSTVGVDLEGVQVYLLPSFSAVPSPTVVERLEQSAPEEEPSVVPWARIYSLPAGTQVFVDGPLFSEDGQAVFRGRARDPLLVVIYDGSQRTLLQRAVWSGRQKNEYWNQFTLASLLTGAFLLALLAYLFLRVRGSGLPALVSLSLAAFPVVALLPPGVLMYFLYRHFWKRARLLRAERDMLRLPLRHFAPADSESPPAVGGEGAAAGGEIREASIRLPTGERYIRTREYRWLIDGPLVIRGSGLLEPVERTPQSYWLFGAVDEAAAAPTLRMPQDPMAELVLVVGEPENLAKACSRKARIYELLSAGLFFVAVTLNLFLLLSMWHLLIR
jgi:hypothetical protein